MIKNNIRDLCWFSVIILLTMGVTAVKILVSYIYFTSDALNTWDIYQTLSLFHKMQQRSRLVGLTNGEYVSVQTSWNVFFCVKKVCSCRWYCYLYLALTRPSPLIITIGVFQRSTAADRQLLRQCFSIFPSKRRWGDQNACYDQLIHSLCSSFNYFSQLYEMQCVLLTLHSCRFYTQSLMAFRALLFIAYRPAGEELRNLNTAIAERSASSYGFFYKNGSKVCVVQRKIWKTIVTVGKILILIT